VRHPQAIARTSGGNSRRQDYLVSVTAAWRLFDHVMLRATWNRLATIDSTDKDVVVIGAGIQWGDPAR
jgi:hypothetical protein